MVALDNFNKRLFGKPISTLYDAWKDPYVTDSTIRQRLLGILTSPFDYNGRGRAAIGDILGMTEEVNGHMIPSLMKELREHPERAEEMAMALIYRLKQSPGSIEAERELGQDPAPDNYYLYYLDVSRQLMPIVTQETADKLFANYPLILSDYDSYPRYEPMIDLLEDKAIPKKYKKTALTQWYEHAIDLEQESVDSWTYPRIYPLVNFMAGTQIDNWDTEDRWVPQEILSFVRGLNFPEESQEARCIAGAFMYTVQHLTKFLPPDEQFDFAWKTIIDNPYEFPFDKAPDIDDEEYETFVTWLKDESNRRGMHEFNTQRATILEEKTS